MEREVSGIDLLIVFGTSRSKWLALPWEEVRSVAAARRLGSLESICESVNSLDGYTSSFAVHLSAFFCSLSSHSSLFLQFLVVQHVSLFTFHCVVCVSVCVNRLFFGLVLMYICVCVCVSVPVSSSDEDKSVSSEKYSVPECVDSETSGFNPSAVTCCSKKGSGITKERTIT